MAQKRLIQMDSFEIICFEEIEDMQKFLIQDYTEQLWLEGNGEPGKWINVDRYYKTEKGEAVEKINDRFYEFRSEGNIITAVRME